MHVEPRMIERRSTGLLGPDGRPIGSDVSDHLRDLARVGQLTAKSISGAFDSYLEGLTGVIQPSRIRARDPFANHVWVFAAAMITAITASQAPLTVMRETERVTNERRTMAKRAGRPWMGASAGHGRRAVQRHLAVALRKRLTCKTAEPDLEHPLMQVFLRPNEFQDGAQLQQLTDLWIAVRGEFFWVLTDDDGQPIDPGEIPSRIYPLSGEFFEPMLERRTAGRLIGWLYAPPDYMPNGTGSSSVKLPMPLHSVIQFKFPNPRNPLRGMSRISAAAQPIEMDLMMGAHNRSVLDQGGVPRLAITHDEFLDPKEVDEFKKQWREIYGGERGDRVAILTGGFKAQEIALSQVEMELLAREKWNRDALLAVMGTPGSKLGLTEFTNYATAESQDYTFWRSTIMPMISMKERAIDGSLLFGETDDVFAMYDLTDVDALRAGMKDKIEIVSKLVDDKIHMPPRQAFEMVGVEAPEYLADDKAFVNGIISGTVDDILEAPPLLDGATETDPAAADATPILPDDPADPAEEKKIILAAAREILVYSAPRLKQKGGQRWKGFVRLETKLERAMVDAYRKWVREERKKTLERFDASTEKALRRMLALSLKDADLDLTAILPDPDGSGNSLKKRTRPVRTVALEETYKFTLDDIGIPTFEIDDPKLMKYFERRDKKFTTTTPRTIIDNLRATLEDGFKSGETVAELRARVGQVYDVSASSAKAATVARTETSNFMNGARDEMFNLQGFTLEDWVTAGDANVREDHQTFGAAGPKARGFNYLDLIGGGSGRLTYPGDMDAPPEQIVNCRCIKVPVE